jgi:hypothetical protein
MQIVFGGAWALIALGIVLSFTGEDLGWVVFCIGFGASILLLSLKLNITNYPGKLAITAHPQRDSVPSYGCLI